MKFYPDGGELDLSKMISILDNGTTEITIETPEGWKCERENCRMDYLHTHGTYAVLNKKS